MGSHDPDELDPRTAELFSQLSRETEALLVDSPHPSEIRRRGERRRTLRRTGYTAGTLGLAVLATAGGLALRNGPVQGRTVVDAAATAPTPAQHSPSATATRSSQQAPTSASAGPASRTNMESTANAQAWAESLLS